MELGSPWEVSKRSKPLKFLPEQHALFCMLTAFMGWTLRQAEACLALLGVSIDHSTIGKAMQRLPESYLERGVALSTGAFPSFSGVVVSTLPTPRA